MYLKIFKVLLSVTTKTKYQALKFNRVKIGTSPIYQTHPQPKKSKKSSSKS